MNLTGRLQHGTVVWTDYQEKGRGQHGNVWLSEQGKNLLFTICLAPKLLAPNKQYLLNLVSSLALHQVLVYHLPSCKVEIKWPNDIYVDELKIAGILTEAVISNGRLEQVYCGIGFNVNQSHFNLPTATSMRILSGEEFDREEVLENILVAFEKYYSIMENQSAALIKRYKDRLRWLGELRRYKISEGELEGVITGIDDHGKLILRCGNEMKSFDVKEIEFLH